MAINWYLVPKSKHKSEPEIGSYEVSGNLTDFPRGVYMVYANKGLVTGLKSREEAERWRDLGKYDADKDLWECPPKEPRP